MLSEPTPKAKVKSKAEVLPSPMTMPRARTSSRLRGRDVTLVTSTWVTSTEASRGVAKATTAPSRSSRMFCSRYSPPWRRRGIRKGSPGRASRRRKPEISGPTRSPTATVPLSAPSTCVSITVGVSKGTVCASGETVNRDPRIGRLAEPSSDASDGPARPAAATVSAAIAQTAARRLDHTEIDGDPTRLENEGRTREPPARHA